MDAVPELQTQTTPVGEVQYLHYVNANHSAPPVILLHGSGFLPWLWHPIARELARKGDVIVPFLTPRPGDDPEKSGTNWLHLAEDVAFIARTLNLRQPDIVGHSLAGMFSQGEYHLIPRCGHFAPMEKPRVVLRVIQLFL